uniref:Uncharacterized protein n=1 Tax=Avena sativa TaxID=4498 RepID=A0ACD5UVC4_AVESA
MEDQAKLLADLTAAVSSMNAKLDDIHSAVLDLHTWKPTMERSVEALRAEVGDLRTRVIDITKPSSSTSQKGAMPPLLPHLADAPQATPPKPAQPFPGTQAADVGGDGHGQFGHGDASNQRGDRTGALVVPEGAPAKGTCSFPCPGSDPSEFGRGWGTHRFPPPPRVDFPLFDGDNPRAWRLKCEAYFQVCAMHPDTWVNCAAMYFIDGALSWLQSSQAHLRFPVWSDFAVSICSQFGRADFQHYLRLFNKLQQTGSVAEYTSKFNELMHNLTAHHNSWEPAYFVTHFIDGLHRDIRAAVLLHQPLDLDTAVDLALLQEGVLESYRQEVRRSDFSPMPRAVPRTALPLPLPPNGRVNPSQAPRVEDRRGGEAPRPVPAEDKLAALRNYRRARGLCFTCGERWSREHRCGPTVQLHVVEELLAMVQPEEKSPPAIDQAGSDAESQFMHISQAAAEGSQAATTMRLQGWIQQQEVLMLIDSGSSHTFVSSTLAEKLQVNRRGIPPLHVKVANGGRMNCSQELVNCEWWTQGYQFHTDFKVLPLGSYDIILGYDWLTQHSPTKVHWSDQTMSFERAGKKVNLKGVRPDVTKCSQVSHEQMQFLLQNSRVSRVVQLCLMKPDRLAEESTLPGQAVDLLEKYQILFEEPTELPPPRQFDHAIPLLPGAKPVNLRPYRYNPAQKDEVERQIKQMLEQGIIRFSTSPYSSPVILVLRKISHGVSA